MFKCGTEEIALSYTVYVNSHKN